MHNEIKTDSAIMLIIASENLETKGMDYWMSKIKLNFEGWEEMIIARRTMGLARNPLGWNKVSGVYFAASGWGNEPDPRAVVHIDEFELMEIEPAMGPRMNDKELFGLLNLELPGLEKVKEAVAENDLESAKELMADYLRHRTSVPWRFDPHNIDRKVGHNKSYADGTVAGEVRVIGVPYTFENGDIDWFYNPTLEEDNDLPNDNEWQWQLGRMGYWSNLGRTYWATGDELYAQTFVKHLRSWTKQCPRSHDSGNYASSAWRTIECGIRMGGSWPDAYHRFLHSPSFTDEDIILYLKSCTEQAQHLREHPTTGNWLTMEMSGLYNVGAVFPELKEAAEWRKFAIGQLYEELDKQFLPDGAQIELTPGYHQVALSNTLKIPDIANVVDQLDELPDDYIAGTERAFNYNMYLMTPDRDMPRFNDSWHVNVPGYMRTAIRIFPEREDFRWIATDGKEGEPPSELSYPFHYAGYYAMRSGWDKEANYLCFDAGPVGYGHIHEDMLNIVVWSYGREILFDGGGGNYERSEWRRYDTDTFSHNTVLVDGLPQRRSTRNRWAGVSKEPIDAGWISNGSYDFASGTYDKGYGSRDNFLATHTRRVLFIKPDMFLIADTLKPNNDEEHTYQARWHLIPTATEFDKNTAIVTTMDKELSNLAIVPLMTDGLTVKVISEQKEPELLGWWVQKGKAHKPATTVIHDLKGVGVKHFLTLLLPLKAGEDNPVVDVKCGDAGEYEVIMKDGRKIAISVDSGIEVREMLADGRKGRSLVVE